MFSNTTLQWKGLVALSYIDLLKAFKMTVIDSLRDDDKGFVSWPFCFNS